MPNVSLPAEVSKKLSVMSFFCACLVVSIHVGFDWGLGTFNRLTFGFVANGYAGIAVPFFFLTSGYLLARHVDEKGWWLREVRKRLVSLGLPFVIFSLINAALKIVFTVLAQLQMGKPIGEGLVRYSGLVGRILGIQWDAWPYMVPLWFVRSLLLFVIISPALIWLLKRLKMVWIAVLIFVDLSLKFAPDPLSGGWSGFLQCFLSVHGLVYFTIGLYLWRLKFSANGRKLAIPAALGGIGLLGVRYLMGLDGLMSVILLSLSLCSASHVRHLTSCLPQKLSK